MGAVLFGWRVGDASPNWRGKEAPAGVGGWVALVGRCGSGFWAREISVRNFFGWILVVVFIFEFLLLTFDF
jgi:hypothetical protein